MSVCDTGPVNSTTVLVVGSNTLLVTSLGWIAHTSCKASHWLLVGFSLASCITLTSCKASHWFLVGFSLASSRLLIGF